LSQYPPRYIYRFDPSSNTWDETIIRASDGTFFVDFGKSVSVSGNNVIVGSPGEAGDEGSAYIYQLDPSSNTWNETKLVASDGAAAYYFGSAVSISGNSAIVGSYQDSEISARAGSAFIYQLDPSSNIWHETKIVASDGAYDDQFGWSVAINGTTAVVGSYLDDDNGGASGSAYIYRFDPSSNNWHETKITASDGAGSDYFGFSVAVHGSNVLVGAGFEGGSGSAYIYQFDPSSNDWHETKITASDAASSDFFGVSVSVHGNIAIVGAEGDDDNGGDSGSSYLFPVNPF